MNEETQEDFEWLLREIVEGGGEAIVCEARLIDGLSDQEVRALVDQARDADYEEVAKDARALRVVAPQCQADSIAEHRIQVARLRKRLAQVVSIDFFGYIGREKAEGLLTRPGRIGRVAGSHWGQYLEHVLPQPVSGRVGLWSKAGSHVYFDDFTVTPAD